MKIYLFILVSITVLFSQTVEHVSIGNKPFTIIKESYEEYGSKGEVMRLYKGEEQNQSSMLLTFILRERNGPCSAREREKGTYEINASTITFYTSWKRGGKAYDAPIGVRVKVYEVLSDSSLKKISSSIYIEASKKNYDKDSGMQYLFRDSKTDEEKESLEDYVEEIENEYNGTFVFAEEAELLTSKVEQAFHRKLKSRWRKKL